MRLNATSAMLERRECVILFSKSSKYSLNELAPLMSTSGLSLFETENYFKNKKQFKFKKIIDYPIIKNLLIFDPFLLKRCI